MQCLRAVAWALLIAAAVAKEVPRPAFIEDRSKVVDEAANKADQAAQAADIATDEANEEELEERAIEKSIEDGLGDGSDVFAAQPDPAVAKSASLRGANDVLQPPSAQPQPSAANAVKMDAKMTRLKKAMQDRVEKKSEVKMDKAADEETAAKKKKKQMAARAAVLKKHLLAQERLRKAEESKKLELERLETAEADTKRKMATLLKRKADEEALLRKAEDHARLLKATAVKNIAKVASKHEGDLDTFIHKAVIKKYGEHMEPEALKKAEAEMRALVEAKLHHVDAKIQQQKKQASTVPTKKFDLDAYVKKVVDAKIKNAGLHLAKPALERLRSKMEAKLKLKVLANHQVASPAKPASDPASPPVAKVSMVHRQAANNNNNNNNNNNKGEKDDDEEKEYASSAEENKHDDESASDEEKDVQDSAQEGQSDDASQDSEQSSDDAEGASGSGSGDDQEDAEKSEEDAGGPEEDPEALIQKKKVRQPILFSTEDADLQPLLHPKTEEAMPPPYKACDELCKFDIGKGSNHDMCVSDCRSFTDSGGDIKSLKAFVTDAAPASPGVAQVRGSEGDGRDVEDEDIGGLQSGLNALKEFDANLNDGPDAQALREADEIAHASADTDVN